MMAQALLVLRKLAFGRSIEDLIDEKEGGQIAPSFGDLLAPVQF